MYLKLVAPASGKFWVPTVVEGILTTPQNKGFDRQHIVRRLDELHESGQHTYLEIDGDALPADERSRLYGDASWAARDGDVRVKPCFGAGGDELGREVPALIGYEYDKPLIVYPHQLRNGDFRTIREYVDAL